ncbi:glycosyltransferase family 2 protein [Lactococcus nasutitermitis]|uniref:Glycosyltransferase family 2 protein n=1 Tax=Lactococcus nasutitermitis TaxID=1652957 RepID=A0ABV9JE95_9LACT|nr:glycosyltransferase family 2 protein [Lactococcus nasutitermitis]
MNEQALISVIIPIYNAETYLVDCLNSILEQTHNHLEIILVNDGSTDNSLKVLQEYMDKKQDKRMKLFSIENSGPAGARNFGLEQATGDFLMFVDSDDTISSDLLEVLLATLKGDDELAMCKFSKDFKRVGEGNRKEIFQTQSFVESVKQMYSPGFASAGPVCKLYGRQIFKNLRFPDIMMYEDAAISLQVLSIANKVNFVDYCGYYYRFNPESLTNKKVSERNFAIFDKTEIVLDFVKEHHPEALKLAQTICINDNDYVMLECTRDKSDVSKKLFLQLFEKNKELSKNLGMRKFVYLNSGLLRLGLKLMNKIYYNDFVRNNLKKVLGV